MNSRLANICQAFRDYFGSSPTLVARAPGRVNLIGEHTDYHGGYVLPMAIECAVLVAVRLANNSRLRACASQFDEWDEFDPQASVISTTGGSWRDYLRGVVVAARQSGFLTPSCELLIDGNVPLAAGLSSSAALEMAILTALAALGGWNILPLERALLGQRAENNFVGVSCGIMDQLISVLGQEKHALFIDCHALTYQPVPLCFAEKAATVAVINSGVPRTLATVNYNLRRQECQEGLAILQTKLARPLATLRDVSLAEFQTHAKSLPALSHRRLRHVLGEMQRVLQAVSALQIGDLEQFGQLLDASHESLRSDYEVSCSELDLLVQLLRAVPQVWGARMTGAGFGGCVIALCQESAMSQITQVLEYYRSQSGRNPDIKLCQASSGASLIVV
ncbi:MAG: galactokinase [Cyanobacteria bacterium NC_groundwater_1444_Ag_S-0.65um_54_12]|nr:galactokinase [Cyanobacteria bacterium NC_groundwater_1444_Ag_S-0.65um_54_12]